MFIYAIQKKILNHAYLKFMSQDDFKQLRKI